MQTLKGLMQDQCNDGGVIVDHSEGMSFEVMDTETGLVWMSVDGISQDEFDNLKFDDPLKPVGTAPAGMNMALFHHSPNREGEPVLERNINGYRCINVATPEKFTKPVEKNGMGEILVNKSHELGYEAGRTVSVISLPEGDFVEVVGKPNADSDLLLPEGASLKTIKLKQPWVVKLPKPTRTLWWFHMFRSFQGPVKLPEDIELI